MQFFRFIQIILAILNFLPPIITSSMLIGLTFLIVLAIRRCVW